MSTTGGGFVVPDCREPGGFHDPPGPRPAAYWYTYRDPWTGLDGLCMVLCVECCARIRLLSQQPDRPSFAPPATHIKVIRDANTLEPVI